MSNPSKKNTFLKNVRLKDLGVEKLDELSLEGIVGDSNDQMWECYSRI